MNMEYRRGELFYHNRRLALLAEEFGTPLYVLSARAVQEAVNHFLAEFQARRIPIKIHYSVKTNPVPGFLKILKQEGLGVEVVFAHELELSRRVGFEGKDIVINGLSKTDGFLAGIVDLPVKMLTVESPGEYARIKAVSKKALRPLNIGLRICPGFSSAGMKPTLSSSAKDSPYGFLPDSPELKEIMKDIGRSSRLQFKGFHIHLGTGIRDSRPYEKAFLMLEALIRTAAGMGLKSRMIDIGGGFGASSAPLLTLPQMAKSALLKKPVRLPGNKESVQLRAVAESLRRLLDRLGRSGIKLEEVLVEPGRILSGSSQILILSVLDTIERSDGRRFLICDGGAMSLTPLLLTEYHRIIPLRLKRQTPVDYAVFGNLPTTLDKLASSLSLGTVVPGDRLAVMDAGAYFIPLNNNFAGPRPAIFLINGTGSGLIRRRETFEDLFSRDRF